MSAAATSDAKTTLSLISPPYRKLFETFTKHSLFHKQSLRRKEKIKGEKPRFPHSPSAKSNILLQLPHPFSSFSVGASKFQPRSQMALPLWF
ncbi:hypothetical protein VNO77_27937 [Canavalia gladiata]|uniref:Uncharacterized protein n=1 Tax=Canavalia gladiata TaxID=3824 RepID=A0AAN9KWS5_CANGL